MDLYRQDDSLEFLDCAPLVYSMYAIFLTPIPKPLPPYLNFIRPYSLTVWLALACCIVICSYFFFILKKSLFMDSDETYLLFHCLFEISGSFLSQCKPSWQICVQQNIGFLWTFFISAMIGKYVMRQSTSHSFYIFLGILFWFNLLLSLAYECNLRAHMLKVG